MKSLGVILALLNLWACATLHSDVFQNIHEGDSPKHVVEVLGEPEEFAPSSLVPGGTAWYYVRRQDVCAIVIKDDTVKLTKCANNPNYVSPVALFGTALQAVGSGGSQQPARQPTRCISSTDGSGNTLTNCN